MIAIALAAFSVSLLGSSHCAGMCGPFVLLAADGPRTAASSAVYHLGRLATYLFLGAAAGLVGAAVDIGAELFALQRIAATAAGVCLIGFGLLAFARLVVPKFGRPHHAPPAWMQRLVRAGYRRSGGMDDLSRPFAIGALTTLLPCGWLYMFVIAAAGTASVSGGVVVMGAFWVGTVPILAGLVVGVRSLGSAARSLLPAATAGLSILVGWQLLTVRAHADFSGLVPAPLGAATTETGGRGDLCGPADTLPCCDPAP